MFAFSKKTAPQTRRFLPEIQALEDRQLLSVSSTFVGGVLRLTGDSRADTIIATHHGNGLVDVNATGLFPFSKGGVKKLIIDTQGGRDTVRVTQRGNLTRDFNLDVKLGNDSDNVIVNLQGDILAGKTMNVRVQGGEESDLITVDASLDVDVQAGASLLVNMNTNDGKTDKMAFAYRGEMDGTLDIDMFGNSGRNTLSAVIGLDAVSSGQVGLGSSRMDAGRGDDTLTFLISDVSGARIDAEMDGGAGFDAGTHTLNVRAFGLESNNVVNFQ
jgi:hypothetical protein